MAHGHKFAKLKLANHQDFTNCQNFSPLNYPLYGSSLITETDDDTVDTTGILVVTASLLSMMNRIV